MTTTQERLESPVEVLLAVTRVLEELSVPYFVTGSFASTVYGRPRTTADADLVASLDTAAADRLVERTPRFYSDLETAREAARSNRSFNLIHRDSMFKIDVFVPADTVFTRSAMSRRQRVLLVEAPAGEAYLASAEDVALSKLVWYVNGGRASERQWSDVVAILQVTGKSFDRSYAHELARELDVEKLLTEAEDAAGR